jgi:hypothetical protein
MEAKLEPRPGINITESKNSNKAVSSVRNVTFQIAMFKTIIGDMATGLQGPAREHAPESRPARPDPD